jgi:transposase
MTNRHFAAVSHNVPRGRVAERRAAAPRSPSRPAGAPMYIRAVESVGKVPLPLYDSRSTVHNGLVARYKDYNQKQGEFLVVHFSDQLLPGTFEYTLNYLIDKKTDISALDSHYKNDTTGAPAYDPRVLLKIVLYAYSRGIYSSRRIMELCQTNIIVKALSANSVPHFTVIADFICSMKEEIRKIFLDVLMVCQELSLVGGEVFAIDGCKLPSNASKESSGTFAQLKKKKEKLEKLLNRLMEQHTTCDQVETQGEGEISSSTQNAIERIDAKIQRISAFLESRAPRYGTRGTEVQSNITDNESAKIKSSHGMIQGYNGIALVDDKHQVIIASEAYGKGQEQSAFTPLLQQAEENLKTISGQEQPLSGKTILADTGYFSEENLKSAAEKEMEAIIPDNNFRKRDERFSDREVHSGIEYKFGFQDFTYNEERNTYSCPNGKVLKHIGHAVLHGSSGHRYQSMASDCKGCAYTVKCRHRGNTGNGKRTLFISDKNDSTNYSARMIAKIDRPEIRRRYSQRMRIVEPVFANITFHKKLNRFTLRRKVKVNIQWLLYCIVHNIGKISDAMAEA